jgi:hypothetical protein
LLLTANKLTLVFIQLTHGRFNGRRVVERLLIIHMRESAGVHTCGGNLEVTVVRLLHNHILNSALLRN